MAYTAKIHISFSIYVATGDATAINIILSVQILIGFSIYAATGYVTAATIVVSEKPLQYYFFISPSPWGLAPHRYKPFYSKAAEVCRPIYYGQL